MVHKRINEFETKIMELEDHDEEMKEIISN